MQSLDKGQAVMLLQLREHALDVLAQLPGGLDRGSTIPEAVAKLRPVVAGLPEYTELLDAAEALQDAIHRHGSDDGGTDQTYSDAIDAFFAFRRKEVPACRDSLH